MEHNMIDNQEYSEKEIILAMQVHECTREEALLIFCEQIRNYRNAQREEYDRNLYKTQRSNEYPDFLEYLDGVVKGDQAQIDKYIADCLAVKQKYPKPE
jgi:hypothetical protein